MVVLGSRLALLGHAWYWLLSTCPLCEYRIFAVAVNTALVGHSLLFGPSEVFLALYFLSCDHTSSI